MYSSNNNGLRLTVLASGLTVMGLVLAAACASDDNSGSGNQPMATNSGAGAAANPGAGAAANPGAGAAANPGAGAAANPGAGAAANPGAGGASGMGGAGAMGMTAFPCEGTAVTQAPITSFDEMTAEFGATGDALTGGGFAYGGPTSDFSSGALVFSGAATDFAGFGVWFLECMDASAYDGLQFMIGGTTVTGNIELRVQTWADYHIGGTEGEEMKGGCEYTEATKWSDCVFPHVTFAMPAEPTLVGFTWDQLTGGNPEAAVTPSQILGLAFDMGMGTGEEVNVTLDDVAFFTGEPPAGAMMGQGGNGAGMGGAGAGGASGGAASGGAASGGAASGGAANGGAAEDPGGAGAGEGGAGVGEVGGAGAM